MKNNYYLSSFLINIKHSFLTGASVALIFIFMRYSFWNNDKECAFYASVVYTGFFISNVVMSIYFGYLNLLFSIISNLVVLLFIYFGLLYLFSFINDLAIF